MEVLRLIFRQDSVFWLRNGTLDLSSPLSVTFLFFVRHLSSLCLVKYFGAVFSCCCIPASTLYMKTQSSSATLWFSPSFTLIRLRDDCIILQRR